MIAPIEFTVPISPATAARAERRALLACDARHDAGLVLRNASGDTKAFPEIMQRHRAKLFVVAHSMLKNRADAEEIVQDTFIRAHRGLEKFRGDCSLATWLHRIALNLARNRHWYFFRRRRHLTVSLDCPLTEDSTATFSDAVADEAAGPTRAAVAREFAALVADCMAQLGAPAREILFLRNSLNRNYEEIAAELGINLGTVKSRIARARLQLRVLLAEAAPEFGPDAGLSAWFEPLRPAGGIAHASV
jgi:RNA polymerase sigma-70 factor (ECF subfamily)